MEKRDSGHTSDVYVPLYCSTKKSNDLHWIQCIDLNTFFQAKLAETDLLELFTEPSLSLSVFRISPSVLSSLASSRTISLPDNPSHSPTTSLSIQNEPTLKSVNQLTEALYSRLCSRDDILLTQTDLNGVFCIRFVVGSERTSVEDVHRAASIIIKEAEMVTDEHCFAKL